MEFELSRRNSHHYFKKSYCLLHSRDGASTREETRHHGRSGERKETVGRRGSWALTQDRLYQDCQATHWKMNISPLAILWTSYQKDCFYLVMNYIPHSSRTFRQKRGGYISIVTNCIQLVLLDHGNTAPLIHSSVQTNGRCLLCQRVWLEAKYSLSKYSPSLSSSRDTIQGRSTSPESFSEKLDHERLLFLDNNR